MMTIWTEQQILLSVVGMVGILGVIPVYLYSTVRNPINK
jgi:hypothetical protein